MKLVFISDLHLAEDTQDSNQIFYNLLNTWQNDIDALYILGDFFDIWCGDDDDSPFIREVKTKLSEFSRVKPIYFIHGNHDFVIGKRFARETGIQILKDMSVVKTTKNTILLSHGDAFCTLDVHYQRLKRIFRSPLVLGILLRFPLSLRYKIKDMLKSSSNKNFNTNPKHIYMVVDDAVAKFANKHKANVVIHGHTHHPGIYPITSKNDEILRFEIPDWVEHKAGGYIMLENEELKIYTP